VAELGHAWHLSHAWLLFGHAWQYDQP